MAFTEDLSPFFASADFGVAATYKAGGTGGGTTIYVIKDEPNLEHLGVAGTRPVVMVKASDIASFSNADTLTIGSTTWRMVDLQPLADGAVIEVTLEEQ